MRAHLHAKRLLDDLKRDSVASGAALPLQASSKRPRLLIVDDDIATIHVLRHALEAMGDFHFAKSGEEALDLARRLAPDLILLDAHMPGLNGFDVCETLKSEAAFKHVPIVFVTRFSDPHNEMRALNLGAADFIAKPYTRAILEARVRNLLDLKQRADAELQAVREHWRRVGDARVADIVAAASDAIVTYDSSGSVVLINAAACRLLNIGHAAAIGAAARGLLGACMSTDEPSLGAPVRKTIKRSDAGCLPVEVSVSCVGEGLGRLTTVVMRDISDRERFESESRARLETETASRTKSLMLSYIAHEMGNPLNGMLGFAQLMAADVANPLPPSQARRLDQILASGERLVVLMRDVMELGRFGMGELPVELQRLDAGLQAQSAAAAVSALAEQAGVMLTCVNESTLITCVADDQRLHQCLVNLLTNAIKYNRCGGWARIGVASEGPRVAITVSDSGIGLDSLQRRHLFEPFNRLGRQAAAPGSGLGLVITRQLVERMNGELRVESEPGVGSRFTILLPSGTGATSAPDAPCIAQVSIEVDLQAQHD